MAAVTITSQDKQLLDALEKDLKDLLKDGTTGAVTIAGPIGIEVPPAALSMFKIQLLALLRLFKRVAGDEGGAAAPAFPQRIPSYLRTALPTGIDGGVAGGPAALETGSIIFVSNATAGAALCYWNGSAWRKVKDDSAP